MEPSPQEKGRRGTKAGDEEFVLYLQGIPAHCRWQELKDFVRQTALHIRQAVVYDDQHGYPTGIGQIIVKNEDEAWRTFRKLSANGWNGQALTVTLARASSPTMPIAGPTRSPSTTAQTLSFGANVSRNPVTETPASTSSVTPDPLATPSPSSYAPLVPIALMNYANMTPASQAMPTTMSAGYLPGPWTANPEAHPFSPTATMFSPSFSQIEYPYYPNTLPVTQQHIYTGGMGPALQPPPLFIHAPPYFHHHQPSYHPLPCTFEAHKSPLYPTSSSYANTIPRTFPFPPISTVIIDNLRPGVDVQTLKTHFRGIGVIEHCEITPYDSGNGQHQQIHHSSGPGHYATATFQSADEAERAVLAFNGTMLAGNQIGVRLDLEGSIMAPLPAVVEIEDWSSSATASPSYYQHHHQPPPPPASSSFPGEGWNMFSPSTSTTSTSSSSTIVAPSSFSVLDSQLEPGSRLRRDSGKELVHNEGPDEKEKPEPSTTTTTTMIKESSKKSHSYSASSAIANAASTAECGTTKHQPLVVNGSMTGRAKM
ncbi:hypothetical protein BGW36DRAFT_425480 [Talaromyces proteolyticus]|uniref:RRM domain-containing protein n=1 Tax=Talaromyces proteolyticus TaxID=1131652 RepID=A0AAD4KZG8_9EURO|nr:uncharacterized protein BGW36DRAFT_425480 [Talaromyces proteolyticus]KAH8700665.1 hypothetical protein BGW36DRAFT_425480 [Talaromyces proteolyticus]